MQESATNGDEHDLIEITTALRKAKVLADRNGFQLLHYLLNVAEQEIFEIMDRVDPELLTTKH